MYRRQHDEFTERPKFPFNVSDQTNNASRHVCQNASAHRCTCATARTLRYAARSQNRMILTQSDVQKITQSTPIQIDSYEDSDDEVMRRVIEESILTEKARIERAIISEIEQRESQVQINNSLDKYIHQIVDDVSKLTNQDRAKPEAVPNIFTKVTTRGGNDLKIDDRFTVDSPCTRASGLKLGMRPHFDFVVGRGKIDPPGYMNFPLNPVLLKRNIIYIDPNDSMEADIKRYLHEVDFSFFGICKDQDPNEEIDVRFIFDWSAFYCGAMQSLSDVVTGIGRRCQILVPLDASENKVPGEVVRELCGKSNRDTPSTLFTLTTVEGRYPLFDWSFDESNSVERDPITQNIKKISSHVNPERYMKIYAFENDTDDKT